jgi:hypothetical protein
MCPDARCVLYDGTGVQRDLERREQGPVLVEEARYLRTG